LEKSRKIREGWDEEDMQRNELAKHRQEVMGLICSGEMTRVTSGLLTLVTHLSWLSLHESFHQEVILCLPVSPRPSQLTPSEIEEGEDGGWGDQTLRRAWALSILLATLLVRLMLDHLDSMLESVGKRWSWLTWPAFALFQ
jgi:hypothetical protein